MAKKAKQGHLNGMEPPSVKEIEEAAEEYVGYRDARMANLKKEIEAGDALLALMQKHELTTYELEDGKTVELKELTKVKVRRPKTEESDE